MTLRRLVELAGLSAHCDFTEQPQVLGEEGALRPDLVVHMPEARDLVIDAKTPLDAFLSALDAGSEEERQQALKRHAQQVETRVRELASKAYWAQFERSPEFAVLFLPGDQFLSAALAERPQLLETALARPAARARRESGRGTADGIRAAATSAPDGTGSQETTDGPATP